MTRNSAAIAMAALLAGAWGCGRAEPTPAAQTPQASSAEVDSIVERARRSRFRGSEGAPATLVEVSDFQCPFCRQFAEGVYHQLDSAYIRTGRVRMLFINYPLPSHTRGYAASEAALCAGAQGRFWQMHDRLFAGQDEWAKSAGVARLFDGYASELGLDLPAFRDCTANDHTAAVVMGDAIEAAAGGVNGTPAFFLIGPGGRRPIAGAVSWPVLQRELETVLAPAAPGQTPPTAPDSTPGR